MLKAALDDILLYEYLALFDANRLGNPQKVNLAEEMLEMEFFSNG